MVSGPLPKRGVLLLWEDKIEQQILKIRAKKFKTIGMFRSKSLELHQRCSYSCRL